MENPIDALRRLFGCATDAELADTRGYSRPTVSRWRRHGIPAEKRIRIAKELRAAGHEVPEWFVMSPDATENQSEAA